LAEVVNFWYEGTLNPSFSFETHTPSAVVAGLLSLGYEINHVAQKGFRKSEWMPCDLCVIYGMRYFGKRIIAEHERRGVPCIVIDLGYIKRAMRSNGYDGYWQVGLGGLNWLPRYGTSDRWEALGIKYPKEKSGGSYVLIAEQVPNDASHGMDETAINRWTQKAIEKCEASGLAYRVRHHPMNTSIDKQKLSKLTIEEDMAGAMAVYVHNSNVGNDALLAGVPVICDKNCEYDPTYADLSCDFKNIKYPNDLEMRDYLHRLSYAQWAREELANGSAFRYVLEQV
jgi:hypothetical protein